MRKVMCPGCGKPMECSKPHLYVNDTPESLKYIAAYRCNTRHCGWIAPGGDGKTPEEALQNAYDNAARRAEPQN